MVPELESEWPPRPQHPGDAEPGPRRPLCPSLPALGPFPSPQSLIDGSRSCSPTASSAPARSQRFLCGLPLPRPPHFKCLTAGAWLPPEEAPCGSQWRPWPRSCLSSCEGGLFRGLGEAASSCGPLPPLPRGRCILIRGLSGLLWGSHSAPLPALSTPEASLQAGGPVTSLQVGTGPGQPVWVPAPSSSRGTGLWPELKPDAVPQSNAPASEGAEGAGRAGSSLCGWRLLG